MKSDSKPFGLVVAGNDMKAAVDELRRVIGGLLQTERAVDAEVTVLRVHTPSIGGEFSLQIDIRGTYRTEVTIDDWLDAALAEAVVEQGPGRLKLPKFERVK